jgi:hypothetical protein
MVTLKKVTSKKDPSTVYIGSAGRGDMGKSKGRLQRLLKDNKIVIGNKTVRTQVSWKRRTFPAKTEERVIIVVVVGDDTIDIYIFVDPNSDPDPGGW